MPEKQLICADPRADNIDTSRLMCFEGSNPVIGGERGMIRACRPSPLRGRRPADDVLRDFQSLVEPPDIYFEGSNPVIGGERGIRTLETLPFTHFPGVRLQPLGHLSGILGPACYRPDAKG